MIRIVSAVVAIESSKPDNMLEIQTTIKLSWCVGLAQPVMGCGVFVSDRTVKLSPECN